MSAAKKGEGVHQSYKEEAKKGFDVLFRVKIKGRTHLTDDIPLHMSLKIFKDEKEFDIKEIEEFAKKHDIHSPDPKKLTFKPIIFKSERTGEEFFMLEVDGLGPQYRALYDEFKDVGNVYKRFFTHITIDKAIYEDIKENGLKPEEIEFSHLILEAGAGNTVKDFEKSEGSFKAEQLIGKYGLSPELIRETLLLNAELAKKYANAAHLLGDDMRRYVEDNPDLELAILEKHQKRLEHHFGPNVIAIEQAWNYGLKEAYKRHKKGSL